MTAVAGPVLFALFLWWFTTGAILWLDGLPRRTFKFSMAGATLLAAASLVMISASAGRTDVAGAYLAFSGALLFWGWFEISFYLGYVTGIHGERCEEGCSGVRHFGHALKANIWHELAIVAGLAMVTAVTWNEPNRLALWTYLLLWTMHESARLNVLLGVRNLNEHFVPEHLDFLKAFLRKAPMNLLFPVSVTGITIAVTLLATAAAGAQDDGARVGLIFLAAMAGLALAEHWFLMLPIPAERLWEWSLSSRTPEPAAPVAPVLAALPPNVVPLPVVGRGHVHNEVGMHPARSHAKE